MKKLIIGAIAAACTATMVIAKDLKDPVVTSQDISTQGSAAGAAPGWLPFAIVIALGIFVAAQHDSSNIPDEE